jgi:ribosomal protein S18 acetylase RimI-like enzyme
MNKPIIIQAIKEDLPIILDIQRKAFLEVAKTFNLKSMPQIEQTLESLTAEFNNCTILKASLADRIVGSVRAYAPGMNPKQTLKTDSAASHGASYPPLCGIVQLTDSDELHSSESEFHNKKDTCYISRLVVLPEYQNKGIGKALMNEI